MRIAYVVYPDFTGLDLVGPYEIISRWPDADVHFVASSPDPRPRPARFGSRSGCCSATARSRWLHA